MSELVVPTVENIDGKLMVSSLNIAKVFNKRHDNILQLIEKLLCRLGDLNFQESSYVSEQGKSLKMYLLDEKFTTLLIMGLTGYKALEFKSLYIDEFIKMRNLINNNYVLQQLLEENKQLKQQLSQQSQDFTEQIIQKNMLLQERKSKSNYYQVVEEIDIFGNKVSKYEHIPRDKELLYKLECCENTAKGCVINGRKYIEELKTLGIQINKALFIN